MRYLLALDPALYLEHLHTEAAHGRPEQRPSRTTYAVCNSTSVGLKQHTGEKERNKILRDDTPGALNTLMSCRPLPCAPQLTFPSLTKNLYVLTSFLSLPNLNGPSFTAPKVNANSFSGPPFHQHCPRMLQQLRDQRVKLVVGT